MCCDRYPCTTSLYTRPAKCECMIVFTAVLMSNTLLQHHRWHRAVNSPMLHDHDVISKNRASRSYHTHA